MSNHEKTAEILNDLIEINNDRIEGYTRAQENTEIVDADLKALFAHFVQQTKGFNAELAAVVKKFGEEPAEGTRVAGKLHRLWLDVKATFSGHDRKSILEECERGEDASKNAYKSALEESALLTPDVASLIREQAQRQLEGHDKIKALRDRL